METSQPDDVKRLRAELVVSGDDYVLLTPLPDSMAHVLFIGRFADREVVWDMRLYTLARHARERRQVSKAPDVVLRGLMIIEAGSSQTIPLEVALNLPVIDEPAVRKTIVMMRNYRRLRPGLITWGDAIESEQANQRQ